MKKDELIIAAYKAKLEINDEIDAFISKIDMATEDPASFITMSQPENEWRALSLNTHKTYSDMLSQTLSAIDTKELNASKKVNFSGKESG